MKLAIKGHTTRGKEIIELLEMMGGSNMYQHTGEANAYSYYISSNVILHDRLSVAEDDDFEIFTLQKFLEKFPFKVGDFVHIPEYESEVRILKMKWCPISKHIEYLVCPNDEEEWFTAVELLEYNDNPNKTRDCKKCGLHFGSVQCFDKDCPHNAPKSYAVGLKDGKVIDNSIDAAEFMQFGKTFAVCFNKENYENEVELQLGDYEIEVRDGKTYAVLKKPKYPKTFEECLNMLYCKSVLRTIIGHKAELLFNLEKLLICRDAYWKIAGEQMGLGKPWEPDWKHLNRKFYCIYNSKNNIVKNVTYGENKILAFPTEEMRDAFKENFDPDIEICKEFL